MLIHSPWESESWERGPSPNLLWSELDCKDGVAYPEKWRKTKAALIGHLFEMLRLVVSAPIEIGSGYRTPVWNKAKKGSRNSTHLEGEAIDCHTPKTRGLGDFAEDVEHLAHETNLIGGIGVYPWGVHFDIRGAIFQRDDIVRRELGRIARWKGSRVAPEVRSVA